MTPDPRVPAPRPDREQERLAALRRYGILDTDAELPFDDITALAAGIVGTPMAMVSLVDEDRAWFKSAVGLPVPEAARDDAFCAWAICEPGGAVMEVGDTQQDPRFTGNPLVSGDGALRFYSGAPLVTSDGHALGTLCVADTVPRQLTSQQRDALTRLARTVMSHLEARRVAQALMSVTEVLDRVRHLSQLPDAQQVAEDAAGLLRHCLDADGTAVLLLTSQGGLRATAGPAGAEDGVWVPERVRLADGRPALTPVVGLVPELHDGPLGDAASCVHVPLLADGEPLGVLVAWWLEPVAVLDVTAERVLEVLAHEVGYALAAHARHRVLLDAAETDPLTGLANRRRGNAQLRQWDEACVAMLDLDHFKRLNDSRGHAAGDEALRQFAVALARQARAEDLLCRWGGEEFLVAVDAGRPEHLERLLERVRTELAARHVELPFSAGIALRAQGEPVRDVLARADAALYAAKAAGRGRTLVA